MSQEIEHPTASIVPFMKLPDVSREQAQALALVESAQALVISTQEQYDSADQFLADVKARYNDLEAKRKELKAPALETCKRIDDLFRPLTDGLKKAEGIIKDEKMKPYMVEQARIQREREAEAARIAEAERKRQEALAEENRRKAEAARENGNEKKAETYEAKAQIQEERAATTPTPIVQPSFAKGKAMMKDNWKAQATDMRTLIQAAAQGNTLAASFLTFNQTAADKQAKASKNVIQVPGVRFYNDPTIAQKR